LISLLEVLNDDANIDKYLLINNKNTSLFDKSYPHLQNTLHTFKYSIGMKVIIRMPEARTFF
jgi:hypothetical protein